VAETQVNPVLSPPHSTSGTASSSTQSSSPDEEDNGHAAPQQTRRRPIERSRLFRPARVTSPGESQSRDLSPVFLPFASSHDSNLSRATDGIGAAQRHINTTSETQQIDLRDTLRSPHRARTAQQGFHEASQTTNQNAHTGNRAGTGKVYATKNTMDTGSTEPQLSPAANAATPSIGSSFSDLDSMSTPSRMRALGPWISS